MKEKTYKVGTITLGDRVHVSDPCYPIDCWCAGTLENVLPGRYICKIVNVQEDRCGRKFEGIYSCVKSLSICHEDHKARPRELMSIDVGVDSGQAGFYDADYYALYHPNKGMNHLDATWYRRVGDITRIQIPNPEFVDKETYLKNKLEKQYISADGILDEYRKLRENEITDEQLHEILIRRFDMEEEYSNEYCSQPTVEIGFAGTLDDRCCVASSGYGDGSYDCYVARNTERKIVAATIRFI